jgi:hypothetical protein
MSNLEVKRIEDLTPIVDGEFLVTAYRGRAFVKRYIRIDVAAEL